MKQAWSRTVFASLLATKIALGCGLVTPLEDLPISRGGNGPATAGSSGATGASGEAGLNPVGGAAGSASGGAPATAGGRPVSTGSGGVEPAAAGAPGQGGDGTCSHSACGENARCIYGECVDLLSQHCQQILGSRYLKDDSTILIGGFAPFNSPGPLLESVRAAYEIVLYELNVVNGGLRGGVDTEPNRVAMILCDNHSSRVPATLAHLLDRVQVPAILAHLAPFDLTAAFDNNKDKALFVSPLSGSRALQARSEGKVWTMLGIPTNYVEIYQALVARIARKLEQQLADNPRPMRFAAVRDAEVEFQVELANSVIPQLELNGEKLATRTDFFDAALLDQTSAGVENFTDKLAEFDPDVVLSFADVLFTEPDKGVAALLERSRRKPIYVLNPQNAERGAELDILIDRADRADNSTPNAPRFLGVAPAGPDGKDKNTYLLEHLRVWTTQVDEDVDNFYEAMSFLVYALYASGPRAALRDGTFSVDRLAAGMRRVTDHSARNRFPMEDASHILIALNGNTNIALIGPRGIPEFDEIGMRVERGSVFCFSPGGSGIKRDVLRFDAATSRLISAANPPCLWGFLDD